MTFIKICGIQPGDDLSFTSDETVGFIGIVFASKSKRYVQPGQARRITAEMRELRDKNRCRAMGVFVNHTSDDIIEIGRTASLDGVQLHGAESVHDCQRLRDAGFLVWKAVSGELKDGTSAVAEELKRYAHVVDGFVLDTPPPTNEPDGLTGGFGVTFDWSRLPDLLQELTMLRDFPPVWIAGGITTSNVATLIHGSHPYGIDVSSGVEINGRKSLNLIQELTRTVKEID